MVTSSLHIQGMKKVDNMFRNLPEGLKKEINKGSEEFLRAVKKSAKLRAPRDTKQLKDSINLRQEGKNWILEVTSPHAKYQEYGFTPHWIHSDLIRGSKKLTRLGFFFVSKSKPFITPALEHNIAKLSGIMSNKTKQAIVRAAR